MSSQRKLSSFFATASTCTKSLLSGSSDNLLGKRRNDSSASLEAITDEDNVTESSDDESDADRSDCDCSNELDRRITSNCTSACCSDNTSHPVHLTLGSKVAKRKQGKQSCSLCSSWFSEHSWLTYCTTKRKVLFLL